MTPEEIDKIAAPVLSRMALGPERMIHAPWALYADKLGVQIAGSLSRYKQDKELVKRVVGTLGDLSDNLRRLPYTDPEIFGQDDFDYLVEEVEHAGNSLRVYRRRLQEIAKDVEATEGLLKKRVLDKIR
jgi:hypothetical protein